MNSFSISEDNNINNEMYCAAMDFITASMWLQGCAGGVVILPQFLLALLPPPPLKKISEVVSNK